MDSDWGYDMSPGIQLAEEIREGCLEEAMAILILKKLTRQRSGMGMAGGPGREHHVPDKKGTRVMKGHLCVLLIQTPFPVKRFLGSAILFYLLATWLPASQGGVEVRKDRKWELSAIPLSQVRASTVSYPLSRDLAPSLMPESEIWPGEVQVTLWIKLRTQSTPTQDSLWTYFSFLWIEGTRAQCPVRSVASAGFCLSLWKSKQRVGSLWLNRVFYTQERPSGWLLMTLLQIYCLPNLRNILIPPRSPWAAILVCIATTLLMTETDSPPGTWCNKRERSADWSSAGSRPHTHQPWPATPPSNWACWRSGKTHRRLFSSAYQG